MRLNQIVSVIGGLLSGAIIGTAVVVLLAPQSGTETRERIAGKVQEIIDAGKQAVAERREQLHGEYQEAIRIPISLGEPDQA